MDDDKVLRQFKKHKAITMSGLSTWYDWAREAHKFYAGDESVYKIRVLQGEERRIVNIAKVRPYVLAVSGFMRQLRRKAEYHSQTPDELEFEEKSEYTNGYSDYFRNEANMDFIESQQDLEMLTTGVGAIDTNIGYSTNPDGLIEAEVIFFEDLGFDPLSRKPNKTDARYVYRRRKFSLEEALKAIKGSKPTDFNGITDDLAQNYQFNPFDGIYTKISGGYGFPNQTEPLVEVYYYQYWDLEKYYRANNPFLEMQDLELITQILAEVIEIVEKRKIVTDDYNEADDLFKFDASADVWIMNETIKGDIASVLKDYGIKLETQEYMRKCFYTAILSDRKVFDNYKSPHQQGFTIKFKVAEYDPINNANYGMVRQMQEPARYANKSLTEILYTIAYNSKGGVMYELDATDDPVRFEREWSTTKAAIQVNVGALSQGKIQPKAQAALPTGYENVYQIADHSLADTSGINREFLGSSENKQVSALFESQRITQVVNTLALYFDAISLYQVEQARLMLTYLRQLAQNNESRLVRIVGNDGAVKVAQLLSSVVECEYDITISEAPTTAAQKEQTSEIMIAMADKIAMVNPQQAMACYSTAIDYLPLKLSDKIKLKKAFESPEPTPEMMQQQQQLQMLAFESQKANLEKDLGEIQYKKAQTEKEAATTAKTLEEAQQKVLENHLLKRANIDNLNVVV